MRPPRPPRKFPPAAAPAIGAQSRLLALMALGPALAAAAPPAGEPLSFVACPIVRDTRSVPCWLSEYEGDLYYLTIQSDVSAEVQPPMLGHQVLVEGIVSDAPAICGGIVLESVRLSVMPELDRNCNTLLPADERYTIEFNPRPPAPHFRTTSNSYNPTDPPSAKIGTWQRLLRRITPSLRTSSCPMATPSSRS